MLSRARIVRSLVLLGFVVALGARTARADEAIEKPINTLVKSVRYNKDDLALKQLDGEAQGQFLLGPEWTKGTPAQRTEFIELFHKLFAGLAFPKIRDNLQNLSTTLYEKPTIKGDKAQIVSTIVIDHPLKKEEMKVQYDLHKAGSWRVVDVIVLGAGSKSMLTTVKEQIDHIYQAQGGWDGLLTKMRERAAQLPKK